MKSLTGLENFPGPCKVSPGFGGTNEVILGALGSHTADRP